MLALEGASANEGYTSPSPQLLAALLSNVDPSYGTQPEQQQSLQSATLALVALDTLLCSSLEPWGESGDSCRAQAAAALSLVTAGTPSFEVADLERDLPHVLSEVTKIIRSTMGPSWAEQDVNTVACDAVVTELLQVPHLQPCASANLLSIDERARTIEACDSRETGLAHRVRRRSSQMICRAILSRAARSHRSRWRAS